MSASVVRSPLLVLLAFLLASCGGSPTQPARDWIELRSIQPADGSSLAASQPVTFTASVDCTVATADGGTVVLLVQNQANRVLNEPAVRALSRGMNTVTLTSTATMPESGATVTVFIPLFVTGSDETRMMKRLSYSVR